MKRQEEGITSMKYMLFQAITIYQWYVEKIEEET